jgi:hypothetical protein
MAPTSSWLSLPVAAGWAMVGLAVVARTVIGLHPYSGV